MRALWLPDPAILRRGESPLCPGVKCMMHVRGTSRQLSGHASGRRTAAAQERMTAASSAVPDRRADDSTIVVDGGLPRSAVVGVLGGGQLGKMLAIEAVRDATIAGPPHSSHPAHLSHNPSRPHRQCRAVDDHGTVLIRATGFGRQVGADARPPLPSACCILPIGCIEHAGAHGGGLPRARPDAGLPCVDGSSPGARC